MSSMPDAVRVANVLPSKSCWHKLRNTQIRQILHKGKVFRTKHLTFKFTSNTNNNGFAIVVSKKVMPLAVDRNHFKRVQRVLYQKHVATFINTDVIVIANKSLYNSKRDKIYPICTLLWQELQQYYAQL